MVENNSEYFISEEEFSKARVQVERAYEIGKSYPKDDIGLRKNRRKANEPLE